MVHCPARARPARWPRWWSAPPSEATRLLFGDTPVRFPMQAVAVTCYADAK